MRVALVRHGKSAYPAGVTDHARPLADRGRREVPRLGAVLSTILEGPLRVLVSSAQRTVETWSLLAPFLGDPRVEYRDDLYETTAADICSIIDDLMEAGTLLIVGHNPGLEEAAQLLSGSQFALPTSTACVLDSSGVNWSVGAYLRGRYLPGTTA